MEASLQQDLLFDDPRPVFTTQEQKVMSSIVGQMCSRGRSRGGPLCFGKRLIYGGVLNKKHLLEQSQRLTT